MTNTDILTIEDITFVRADTSARSRRTVFATILLAAVAGLALVLLVVLLRGVEDLATGIVAGAAITLAGLVAAFRWYRHYRSVLATLDGLEARVRVGEQIRGSEVQFP